MGRLAGRRQEGVGNSLFLSTDPAMSSPLFRLQFEEQGQSQFKFTFKFKFRIGGMMARFDPEKMAVYRLARQHTRAVRTLLAEANTRGFADLVSQLRRSASSITANILESTGEWRPGKRAHYLMIAKGSTWESWAHTDRNIETEQDPGAEIEFEI